MFSCTAFRYRLGVRVRARSPQWLAVLPLLLLGGCGTLTESTTQQVMVQTVLDHQEVAGVGCVLFNDSGKWFVTTPGRVVLRKSRAPLYVDCRKHGAGWAYDEVASRENSTLWGNVALTAGLGIYVDRNTGQGFEYPNVLTVELRRRDEAEVRPAPDVGRTVY
jgi:hypothetical protein